MNREPIDRMPTERDPRFGLEEALDGELGRGLAELLSAREIEAVAERCTR